jgi:hypothetical protein
MPLSRQTSLNEAPSAIRSQTFSANSGVYRVSVTFDFSLFIFIAHARAYCAADADPLGSFKFEAAVAVIVRANRIVPAFLQVEL